MNYNNSLLVTVTVTCCLRAPFTATGDHYLHVAPSSGRYSWKRQQLVKSLIRVHTSLHPGT